MAYRFYLIIIFYTYLPIIIIFGKKVSSYLLYVFDHKGSKGELYNDVSLSV